MKMKFIFANGVTKESPNFSMSNNQDDMFFDDYLGSDNMLFNSDVSKINDSIIVEWFEDPKSPDMVINEINNFLGTKVPKISNWI